MFILSRPPSSSVFGGVLGDRRAGPGVGRPDFDKPDLLVADLPDALPGKSFVRRRNLDSLEIERAKCLLKEGEGRVVLS